MVYYDISDYPADGKLLLLSFSELKPNLKNTVTVYNARKQ